MSAGYKVLKSGHVIEIYRYEKSPTLVHVEEGEKKGGRKKEGEEIKEDRKEEYRLTVNNRARQKIRRLALANFDEKSLFVTLTYKENMQDIEQANYDFKKYIQKIKRLYKNFKHLSVIEFQERGAIHYHMLCNIPHNFNRKDMKMHIAMHGSKPMEFHVMQELLGEKWGNGLVMVEPVDDVDNVGAYISYYMSKDGGDKRLDSKKRYFYSRDLITPEKLEGKDAELWLNTLEGVPPVFTNEYEGEFTGNVMYREYNLKRGL